MLRTPDKTRRQAEAVFRIASMSYCEASPVSDIAAGQTPRSSVVRPLVSSINLCPVPGMKAVEPFPETGRDRAQLLRAARHRLEQLKCRCSCARSSIGQSI